MNLIQFLRYGAVLAKEQLKKVVTKTDSVTQVSVANSLGGPRRLRVAAVEAYRSETHDLLDTGAISNIILWNFRKRLALFPMATDRQVTVADGTVAEVVGCVEEVLVSCVSLVVLLNCLVLRNAPFDSII